MNLTHPTKTRRLPIKTRVRPGGTTEVFYSVAGPITVGRETTAITRRETSAARN